MSTVEVSVSYKYGPRIQREPGRRRYHCLAYPCPNLTRLFYRPANSNLCAACIREREPRAAVAAEEPLRDGREAERAAQMDRDSS